MSSPTPASDPDIEALDFQSKDIVFWRRGSGRGYKVRGRIDYIDWKEGIAYCRMIDNNDMDYVKINRAFPIKIHRLTLERRPSDDM